MSRQPWETHDPLCPNRRPAIAFPNSACSGCRAVVAARAEGYARGLIEGDHGGRKEGERIGIQKALIAWKEAEPLHDAEVRAQCQRDEREKIVSILQNEYHACLRREQEGTKAAHLWHFGGAQTLVCIELITPNENHEIIDGKDTCMYTYPDGDYCGLPYQHKEGHRA